MGILPMSLSRGTIHVSHESNAIHRNHSNFMTFIRGIEVRVRETDIVFKESALIFVRVLLHLSLLCSKISAE